MIGHLANIWSSADFEQQLSDQTEQQRVLLPESKHASKSSPGLGQHVQPHSPGECATAPLEQQGLAQAPSSMLDLPHHIISVC